jgi:hypothetical protein
LSDLSDRFLNAIAELEAVADGVTADDAREQFDQTTLQAFWRDWPHISSWAGGLWRKLNDELEPGAKPAAEGDEIGGEGGG